MLYGWHCYSSHKHITSIFIAYIQSLAEQPIAFLPEFKDFSQPGSILGGVVLGTFFVPAIRYLEFSSIRLIKAENHFAVAAFAPLSVLLWEGVFASLGLFEVRTLSSLDLLSGILITTGALFTVYVRIKREMGGHFDLYEYMQKVGKEAAQAEETHKKRLSEHRRRMEDQILASQDSREIIADTI